MNRITSRCAIVGAVLLGGAPLATYAQDAGSRLRDLERQQDLQRLEQAPRPAEPEALAPRELAPEPGETSFIVRGVQFTGQPELLPGPVRDRVTESLKGKRVGLGAVRAAADEATAALHKEGHVLARVVLPPQDVTDGVVTFNVVEAGLEGIELESGPGVRAREDRLRTIGEAHIRTGNLTLRDLESALLRMNDHPGVIARAKLTPGAEPTTSRLIVDVRQAPALSAWIDGQNFGSAPTGEAQGNVTVAFADLTGYGDLTQLSALTSDGQTFAQVQAAVPLGASPFTLSARYGYLDYRYTDEIGDTLELDGRVRYARLGLEYALLRSRDVNLRLSGSLNHKALVDDSVLGRLQDKRSRSATLELLGDARDRFLGGGLTSWSLGWTYGDLDLSRVPAALAIDELTLQTNGHFQSVVVALARLQKMPGRFSLFGRLYGQWATRNLDSSEDFALGGPYGVRGYPVGEGRGDGGVLGTVELRYDAPIPSPFGHLQLATLLDAGRVRVNRHENGVPLTNACGCNEYDLSSAGIAARWTRERISLSASWAHALKDDNPGRSATTGTNVDGSRDRDQLWLRGAIRF